MNAIMLFGSAPSKDGTGFGTRREEEFFKKVKDLGQDTNILLDREVIGFSPPKRYSELMASRLLALGLPGKKIVVLPIFANATIDEIDAAEIYLKEHPEVKKVYAASSWFHLPRIWLWWMFRHRRFVRFCPCWNTDGSIFQEPLKYPLVILPLSWQGGLGKLWRRVFY